MPNPMLIEAHRHIAAAWLLWARRKTAGYKVSAWDLCVIAGTRARAADHIGAYEQIKAIAIKFGPTANFYLG